VYLQRLASLRSPKYLKGTKPTLQFNNLLATCKKNSFTLLIYFYNAIFMGRFGVRWHIGLVSIRFLQTPLRINYYSLNTLQAVLNHDVRLWCSFGLRACGLYENKWIARFLRTKLAQILNCWIMSSFFHLGGWKQKSYFHLSPIIIGVMILLCVWAFVNNCFSCCFALFFNAFVMTL